MPLFGQPFEEYENVWQTLDRHHSVQWKQHENNLFVSQGDFEHLMTAGTLAHLQWKTWIHLSYKVFPWGPTKTQKHQEVNRNLCCTNSLSAAHMSEFNCQRICNAAKYTIHLWPVDIFSTLLMTSFMDVMSASCCWTHLDTTTKKTLCLKSPLTDFFLC